jgi:FAD/FMN-containing dehydrogenase
MISRRGFMAGSVALVVASKTSRKPAPEPEAILVNDIHSQLNPTRVLGVSQPRSAAEVQSIVRSASKDRKVISVAGGRHAMGGQQFGTDTLLLDIRKMSRVLQLDRKNGILEVEAGIEWPELIDGYLDLQNGDGPAWGITQKQTGADRFTMAGTIAANAHGRGLTLKPFVSDVESFVLVDATGTAQRCSRRENPELFRLVHGGYGLFGIVTPCNCASRQEKKLSAWWKFGR